MSHMLSLLRLVMLLLSCYGYVRTVSKYVRVEFSIGITFAAIGSLMFFAGILNTLWHTAWVICLTGIYLAVRSFYRKESLKGVISFGTLFFVVACAVLALVLHRAIFTHYDNFSHWALATKVLIQKDRFPNYTDINVVFQSYPLGYAAFIYYVTEILDISTEWVQMLAQAMLMCGILTSFFAFAKSTTQRLLAVVGCVFFLAGNTGLTDLLVDTLLPVTALGGMLFCIYYRDTLYEKAWWTIPYTVFLVSVKNSGIFFSLVILIYLLCHIRSRSDVKKWLVHLLVPVTTLLLWQRHVELVFDDGMMTFHSLSLDYFRQTLGRKNPEHIASIFSSFTGRVFSLENPVLFVCAVFLIAWAACIIFRKERKNELREYGLMAGTSYVLFQVMMFGMYLVTMPIHEALQLAEYDRYHDTILIFVSGIALLALMRSVEALTKERTGQLTKGVALVLTACCLYFAVTPKLTYYTRQDPNADVRGMFRLQYEALIEEYDIPTNARYAVLIRENPNSFYTGFLKYITRYLLDPAAVTIEAVDEFDWETISRQYDYLIVFDTTEDVVTYMNENFPEVAEQRVIRLPSK